MGPPQCKCKRIFALEKCLRGGIAKGKRANVPLDNSRYNEYYLNVKPGGGP
jgi:hypothetical protein